MAHKDCWEGDLRGGRGLDLRVKRIIERIRYAGDSVIEKMPEDTPKKRTYNSNLYLVGLLYAKR